IVGNSHPRYECLLRKGIRGRFHARPFAREWNVVGGALLLLRIKRTLALSDSEAHVHNHRAKAESAFAGSERAGTANPQLHIESPGIFSREPGEHESSIARSGRFEKRFCLGSGSDQTRVLSDLYRFAR